MELGLQARLVIDRDTASRFGIRTQTIDDTLYDAFGQRQVSIMYKPLNQYHVVMEVAPEFSKSTEALQNIHVRAGNGTATVQCTRTGVAARRLGRGACVGLCGSIQEPQTNRRAIERYGPGRLATATR